MVCCPRWRCHDSSNQQAHSFCKWQRGGQDDSDSAQAQPVQDRVIGRKGQRMARERSDLRQRGDSRAPRPYLLKQSKKDEMMKAREGEFKSETYPQAQSNSKHSCSVNPTLRIQSARSRGGPKRWQQVPAASLPRRSD
jgi:hypothetical protein